MIPPLPPDILGEEIPFNLVNKSPVTMFAPGDVYRTAYDRGYYDRPYPLTFNGSLAWGGRNQAPQIADLADILSSWLDSRHLGDEVALSLSGISALKDLVGPGVFGDPKGAIRLYDRNDPSASPSPYPIDPDDWVRTLDALGRESSAYGPARIPNLRLANPKRGTVRPNAAALFLPPSGKWDSDYYRGATAEELFSIVNHYLQGTGDVDLSRFTARPQTREQMLAGLPDLLSPITTPPYEPQTPYVIRDVRETLPPLPTLTGEGLSPDYASRSTHAREVQSAAHRESVLSRRNDIALTVAELAHVDDLIERGLAQPKDRGPLLGRLALLTARKGRTPFPDEPHLASQLQTLSAPPPAADNAAAISLLREAGPAFSTPPATALGKRTLEEAGRQDAFAKANAESKKAHASDPESSYRVAPEWERAALARAADKFEGLSEAARLRELTPNFKAALKKRYGDVDGADLTAQKLAIMQALRTAGPSIPQPAPVFTPKGKVLHTEPGTKKKSFVTKYERTVPPKPGYPSKVSPDTPADVVRAMRKELVEKNRGLAASIGAVLNPATGEKEPLVKTHRFGPPSSAADRVRSRTLAREARETKPALETWSEEVEKAANKRPDRMSLADARKWASVETLPKGEDLTSSRAAAQDEVNLSNANIAARVLEYLDEHKIRSEKVARLVADKIVPGSGARIRREADGTLTYDAKKDRRKKLDRPLHHGQGPRTAAGRMTADVQGPAERGEGIPRPLGDTPLVSLAKSGTSAKVRIPNDSPKLVNRSDPYSPKFEAAVLRVERLLNAGPSGRQKLMASMKNYKPAPQKAQAQSPSAPPPAAKPQAKKRFAIPFGDVGTISPRLKKALLIRAIAGAMRK